VELVLQAIKRVDIRTPNWLLDLEDWELDLLHSILWKNWNYFTDQGIADAVLQCLLSGGKAVKLQFEK
jgi:hypothetical protein